MRRRPYPERRNGKRVWLAPDEVDQFLDTIGTTNQRRVAAELGVRCGLRRNEIVGVTPADVVDGPTGETVLRVREDVAKFEKYRETPVPDTLAARLDALGDVRGDQEPVVDVTGKSVYRWVTGAAEELADETGDDAWRDLDVHDLRRTWGVALLEDGVIPSVVMDWGGWDDWDTFRKHYLGEFSPRALKRERAKVSFLGGTQQGKTEDYNGIQVGTVASTRHPRES
jgi:integrase